MLGGGDPIVIRDKSGMFGTSAEAIHAGFDRMLGIFTNTRVKLLRLTGRSTSNTDSNNVSAKRIKLTDESLNDQKIENARTISRSREERSAIGSFSGPAILAGNYSVNDNPDTSTATSPATPCRTTPSADQGKDMDSSSAPLSTAQPLSTRHPARHINLANPRWRSHIYTTGMSPKGTAKTRVSPSTVVKPRARNRTVRTPDDSVQPGIKDEPDGERGFMKSSDDTSDQEVPESGTSLTVFDNSRGILDTTEAFGELKISGTVIQREEREREAREREKELERQRIEQERQREEERKRLEEDLRRQAEEQRLREEAERGGGLRPPKKDLFPPLTAEWREQVQRSLQPGGGDLVETPETMLKSHDFERLVPSTVWLNDNIVNGTLLWFEKYINEAAGITDVKTQTRKCLMPGSFFFTRLLDHGVRGTERTLRRLGVNKDNILDIETILMPICQVNHWTLVVIEPRKRKISHFDSLNPAGSDGKRTLAKEWMKTILGDSFVDEEWSFAKYKAPRQTNGWDCGVHTVLNGVCLGLGIEPSSAYSSDQLPELRKRIAAILLNQGFKGEFSLEGC